MILKGNQRGGGKQLAAHLLNEQDNEHVHVHEMRGFVADDLPSAFHEAYAVSKGTRAKQFLFSLSLNPPARANVSTEAFERAIDMVEQRLGLENQPRAIVFHEKEGRRHAHAVWSRIDAGEMKAINLPYTRLRLRDVSKELYLEHGWQMPRGLVDSRERDPANFSLEEWQQAKRGGHDPKALKAMFQECWAASDSGKAFAASLAARGYTLAQGDRRGHVAVDYRGEVYAIAKFVGVKTKAVRDKLGVPETLPTVDEAKRATAERMTEMLERHIREREAALKAQEDAMAARKRDIVLRQRQERAAFDKAQAERSANEARDRAQRFSKGLRGLWDRMTGKHAAIRRQNEREAAEGQTRDRGERDKLVFGQIDERRALHRDVKEERQRHDERVAELHQDIAAYAGMKDHATLTVEAEAGQKRSALEPQRAHRRSQGRDREL